MKKLSIFIILFLLTNILKSQISDLHFGVFYKTKLEMMEVLIPNEDLISNPYFFDDYYWVFSANMTYNRFLVSLEYSYEYYNVSYLLKRSKSVSGFIGSRQFVEYGNTYGMMISYYIFPVKNKFNILPGMGITYMNTSGSLSYFSGRLKTVTGNGEVKVLEQLYEYNREGAKYLFLKPKIEFTYTPLYFLTLFVQCGYNFGFKSMGYIEGWYKIEDNPQVNFKNSTKGDNIYFGIGGRVNFSLNIEKSNDTIIK